MSGCPWCGRGIELTKEHLHTRAHRDNFDEWMKHFVGALNSLVYLDTYCKDDVVKVEEALLKQLEGFIDWDKTNLYETSDKEVYIKIKHTDIKVAYCPECCEWSVVKEEEG